MDIYLPELIIDVHVLLGPSLEFSVELLHNNIFLRLLIHGFHHWRLLLNLIPLLFEEGSLPPLLQHFLCSGGGASKLFGLDLPVELAPAVDSVPCPLWWRLALDVHVVVRHPLSVSAGAVLLDRLGVDFQRVDL